MSGLEIVAVVSAVISAFHGGSELVKHLHAKRKKKKSEQAMKEKMLMEALEAGEVQIYDKYQMSAQELGTRFRSGDFIARERLQNVLIAMQAEIIRSLQIAIQYDNAILNINMLHEASLLNRRDTITALDELKQRLLMAAPLEQLLRVPLDDERRPGSMDSVRTFLTAYGGASDLLPPAVTISEPEQDRGSGMSRFLSVARRPTSSRHNNMTSPTQISLIPNFEWLRPAISRDNRPRPPSADLLHDFNMLQVDDHHMANHQQVMRPDSISIRSVASSNRTSSVPSIPPLISDSRGSTSPDPTNQPCSPTSPITPDNSYSPYQGFHPGYTTSKPTPRSPTIDTYGRLSPTQPERFRSSSVYNPNTTSTTLVGRPNKNNSYWGFCKGAWSAAEDLQKGVELVTQPAGLYGHTTVFQCRHCQFQGRALPPPPGSSSKKSVIDRTVFTSQSGIRYRWGFLAKSHVKAKASTVNTDTGARATSYNYGCVFCCKEGKSTSIFGDAQTLMNHVWERHARGGGMGMPLEVQIQMKCVWGRVAEMGEDFDINIPRTFGEEDERGEEVEG